LKLLCLPYEPQASRSNQIKNVLSVRVSHLKSFIGFKAYFQFVLTSMNSEAHDEAKRLFGDKVQALRKEKGITQERLAELIEKSVEHVSYIERENALHRSRLF